MRIQLLPAQAPERFSVSPALSRAIGEYLGPSTAFTKQDIVMATWEYIKRRNLIKEDDCRVVVCDYALTEVLECVSLPFTSIIPALKPHLTPVRTVDLEYTLSLDGAKEDEVLDEKFFDVDVSDVCEVTRARTRALRDWDELQQEQRKELAMLKRQERDIVERLHSVALKHEWMRQFAADPCGFTSELAKSQDADQQVRSLLGPIAGACNTIALMACRAARACVWSRSCLQRPSRTTRCCRPRTSSRSRGSARSRPTCSQPLGRCRRCEPRIRVLRPTCPKHGSARFTRAAWRIGPRRLSPQIGLCLSRPQQLTVTRS